MRAILYRDLISIKNQGKNFLLSLGFLLLFPFVIKFNNLKFLDTDYLFLIINAMIPTTIGLQFSNYLLLEDKKNDIFPLLFRNGLTIQGFYILKAIVPVSIAMVFNLLSFAIYNLFFRNLLEQFRDEQLLFLFFIDLSLTVLALFISEILIFIVKSEVYYPSSCVIVSILIIGFTFYFFNPFDDAIVFFGLIVFFSLMIYFLLYVLLRRKYNYFRGRMDG